MCWFLLCICESTFVMQEERAVLIVTEILVSVTSGGYIGAQTAVGRGEGGVDA